MRVCISRWLAVALTLSIACGMVGVAHAQRIAPETGYAVAGSDIVQPVSDTQIYDASYADGEKGLQDRVKKLEDALKKMKAKEDADKKKKALAPNTKITGFVFADSTFFGQNAQSRAVLGDAGDTTYFRTARLAIEGDAFCQYYYKAEFDFAGLNTYTSSSGLTGNNAHTHTVSNVQTTPFKDIYIGIKDLPYVGRVQVGHFKEPMGLEELTSDRFLNFTERGFTSVFTPTRNMGVMAINNWAEERGTWAAGVFRNINDIPPYIADDRGFYHGTGRVTFLPWYDENPDIHGTAGRGLIHVGASYSYQDWGTTPLQPTTVQVRSRPEVGVGPYVVDTGTQMTSVRSANLGGLEAAMVYGPLSIQSEWIVADYARTGALPDATFNAGYVFVSYFITGEHRPYRKSAGCFDRVKPYTNFFRVRTTDGNIETGWGALEVGYRFSWINLDNGPIAGGNAQDHTLGVNWYLTPYLRLMGDYCHSNVSPANNGANTWIDWLTVRCAFEY